VIGAALAPDALIAIERLLLLGRYELRRRLDDYFDWLLGPGATESPAEQQRRLLRRIADEIQRMTAAQSTQTGRSFDDQAGPAVEGAAVDAEPARRRTAVVQSGTPVDAELGPPRCCGRARSDGRRGVQQVGGLTAGAPRHP
jgi:hypothetical protein